jgi:tRNA(Ile)-lysidine synthetase-like protein
MDMANIQLSKQILKETKKAYISCPIKRNAQPKLVLMCSSGVDSIASTHFLMKKYKSDFFSEKIVFHYNHNLREQNNKMQSSVERFCEKYKFNLICGKAEFRGDKSEDCCRKLRFNEVENLFKDSVIVTSHHLNDCVESYLLNCFRGNPEYNPIPFFTLTMNGNVISHPFLFTYKNDFIQYAERNKLYEFIVEDETNQSSVGSRRNMIRNKIVPILHEETLGIETIVKKRMTDKLSKISCNSESFYL